MHGSNYTTKLHQHSQTFLQRGKSFCSVAYILILKTIWPTSIATAVTVEVYIWSLQATTYQQQTSYLITSKDIAGINILL
jgi:hypothetical protein